MAVASFAYSGNAVALVPVRLPVALRQVHERIVVVALIGKTIAPLRLPLHTSHLVARIVLEAAGAALAVFYTDQPSRLVPLVVARHPAGHLQGGKIGNGRIDQ